MPPTDAQSGFSPPPKVAPLANISESNHGMLAAHELGLAALAYPACIIGADRRFLFANQAYVALFLQNRSLTGVPAREVLSDAVYNLVEPFLAAALMGTTNTFSQPSTDAHGVKHWLDVNCAPSRRRDGAILGVTVTLRHVEDNIAEASMQNYQTLARSLLRALANSAGDLLVYVDCNFILRFANNPFLVWTGRLEKDLLNRHIADVFDRTITLEQRHGDIVC